MSNRRRALVAAGGGALVLIITVGFAGAYASKHLVAGTKIGGANVAGMTRAQAELAVTEHEQKFLHLPLQAEHAGKQYQFTPQSVGITFDNRSAFEQAFLENVHTPLKRIVLLTFRFVRRIDIPVAISPVTEQGKILLDASVWPELKTAATEPSLSLIPGSVSIVPGTVGTHVVYAKLSDSIASGYVSPAKTIELPVVEEPPVHASAELDQVRLQAERLLAGPLTVAAASVNKAIDTKTLASMVQAGLSSAGVTLTFKQDALTAFLSGLQSSIGQSPQNARLGIKDGHVAVVVASKDGITLDMASAISSFNTYLAAEPTGTVTLKTAVAKASVREDSLDAIGIHDRIGTATTDFSGSPGNRVFNITLGTKDLDSKVVADGASFSTISALSPIDEAHGYKDELVILGNRTVPEAGGGLCQVSTTLFRAVLSAGLPVIERTNHAYRVGYYEVGVGPGLDATVYDPKPDFVWKNDTGHPIFVQSQVVGNKVTFELYGTSDGRISSVSAPQVLEETPPGDPIYTQTDTLTKGVTQQIEHPHPGAKTVVSYTVSKGGQTVATQTFRSTYRPWPSQFLVGTR